MAPRPCLGVNGVPCGVLTTGTRCPRCTQAVQRPRWRQRQRQRPTTSEAGYGSEHQRLRKAIAEQLAQGEAAGCWRCGQAITAGMAWDLGHDDADRSIVRGAEHSNCNRATMRAGRATATRNRSRR